MTAKHTPGPWVSSPHGDKDWITPASFTPLGPNYKYPTDNDGCSIAQCYGPDKVANARLIATAPGLLALAKRVVSLGQHPAPGQRECLCGQCDMVRTAIALIEKAEGEKQ